MIMPTNLGQQSSPHPNPNQSLDAHPKLPLGVTKLCKNRTCSVPQISSSSKFSCLFIISRNNKKNYGGVFEHICTLAPSSAHTFLAKGYSQTHMQYMTNSRNWWSLTLNRVRYYENTYISQFTIYFMVEVCNVISWEDIST